MDASSRLFSHKRNSKFQKAREIILLQDQSGIMGKWLGHRGSSPVKTHRDDDAKASPDPVSSHPANKRSIRHTYHRQDRGSESNRKKVAITVIPRLPLGSSSGTARFRLAFTRDTERHRASEPFPVNTARFQTEVYRTLTTALATRTFPDSRVSRWEWDEKETERERMEGMDRRSRSCLPLGRASLLKLFTIFSSLPLALQPLSGRARDKESLAMISRAWRFSLFYFILFTLKYDR